KVPPSPTTTLMQASAAERRCARKAAHANQALFERRTVRSGNDTHLSVALEQVCIALRTGDCDDDVKQAIANKIIELAKTGERNADLLCECAVKGIREPQV